MVASAAAWDLTGQSNRSVLPSGSSSTQTQQGGGSTSRVSDQASQTQITSSQNTPQFALEALQQLISQLSDRPRLSNEEVSAQFPLSERVWINSQTGWGYQLPNGALVSGPTAAADAKKWDAQQLAKRQQAQQASGVTAGGTSATAGQSAQRSSEIKTLSEGRAGFSKEAAFADASALAGKFQRQLLETLMPQITGAIESSGTSGGAVAGLLAQDAATRVAEAQASLGLQTATQYGQISNQMSQILAELAMALPPELQALLQALGISKGTIEQGVTSVSSTSQKTAQTQENKTGEQQTTQTGNLPLALKIVPSGASPSVAGQTQPNIIGASKATLDQTLQDIVRRDTFGGSFAF
jgi:hypothetical protein